MKRNRERCAAIVEAAERQVGYHAQPQKRNGFSPRTYDGREWNGAFVQRVLRDAFGTEPEVNFTSTVTALGFYTRANRLYRKPTVGSVVFFNFATDALEWDRQPHIGVVSSVGPNGVFRTIEGQTLSGKPQGIQLADGVHERVRHGSDVIGFVRPEPRTVNPITGVEPSTVKMSYFESNGKTVARAVTTVQTALNRVNRAFTFNRGKRDGVFRSALGVYARETGTVENRGEITEPVLKRLADETGFVLD